MTRLPHSGITCPNCGCAMRGEPCDVCGYIRHRAAIYPIGRDALTDSYVRPLVVLGPVPRIVPHERREPEGVGA